MNTIAMAKEAVESCAEAVNWCFCFAVISAVCMLLKRDDSAERLNAFNWMVKFLILVFVLVWVHGILRAGLPVVPR